MKTGQVSCNSKTGDFRGSSLKLGSVQGALRLGALTVPGVPIHSVCPSIHKSDGDPFGDGFGAR